MTVGGAAVAVALRWRRGKVKKGLGSVCHSIFTFSAMVGITWINKISRTDTVAVKFVAGIHKGKEGTIVQTGFSEQKVMFYKILLEGDRRVLMQVNQQDVQILYDKDSQVCVA